ncbi:hypothetical protein ACP4OV_002179 [Aristida adscensionis]
MNPLNTNAFSAFNGYTIPHYILDFFSRIEGPSVAMPSTQVFHPWIGVCSKHCIFFTFSASIRRSPYLVLLPVTGTNCLPDSESRSPRTKHPLCAPSGAPAMAAVLDALAPYVMKLIGDMAQEEVQMLLGVSGEINKLKSNMDSTKDFLADAERRRITNKTVQRWVAKLKGAMYDATDILDLCKLEADKRKESKYGKVKEKVPDCFQSLLFCLWNPAFAHKIGSRIKELNQRLEDIHKEANRFNFNINLGSNLEPRRLTDAEHSSISNTTPQINVSTIVGEKIERETKELVYVLINGYSHNIKAVSIVGAGGMGKTTLAQKIYNDTTIQEHFKIKIWLSITKEFNMTELLQTAIKYAGSQHGGEKDKGLLTQILTNTLSKGRFLLVMDDVWSEKVWDNILSVPVIAASNEQPGSRVLITTRLQNLAPHMRIAFRQHHVSPLDDEDAWSLLKNQLPPNKVTEIDNLKDIGLQILRKCDGLPLAIKVMGGLLSTKFPNEREWKEVLESPAWSVAGLPQELDSRLYMSYEDMSPQLKQCFLYCSVFSKSKLIILTTITNMWVSEGFIQPLDRSNISQDDRLEEVAIEYYQELITRNLIEPTEEYSLSGYRCTMHDVVRSFAEFMAGEELLMLVQNRQAATDGSGLVRRLSIGPTVPVAEWTMLQKHKSLRTFVTFSRINIRPGDALSSFSSLRVIQIVDADIDGLRETPAIKRIGPEFQGCSLVAGDSSATSAPFTKLRELQFDRLCEWEEWEWNAACDHEDVKAHIAMPTLERLDIRNCKLSCLPPGLADSRRHALRELWLYRITNLTSVENFPSVVHLDVFDCPDLKRISGLSRLQKIRIVDCSNLDVLEGVPVLDSLVLEDSTMETLPGYQAVKPRYLDLICNRDLYDSLKSGTSSELEKINHIRSRNIDYWPKED